MLSYTNPACPANKLFKHYNIGQFLLWTIKSSMLLGILVQYNPSIAAPNSYLPKIDDKSAFIIDQDQHSNISLEERRKALEQWHELLIEIKDLMIKQRGIKQPKAFISYAWEDTSTEEGKIANSRLQRYLEKLRDDLQAAGILVFLDIGDMHGNMKKRMEENLVVSDVIITINTPRFRARALAEPQTNLGFEYQLTLKKAAEIPYGIFPLHYSGSFEEAFGKWGDEKELKELKGYLIRDCQTPESYQSTLVATQRPLGIIPAIYNLDCDNNSEYSTLIKNWRWAEFSSMPLLNQDFVGRREFLAKISSALKDNSVQTLSGMGGMGKSEIAIAYAHRHKNEYGAIRLLSAESSNIKLEFERMADLFGIDNKGMSVQELSASVYKKIGGYKWLLIFDNAEDYESIKDYLPKTIHDQQHILITSRNQHWQNLLVIDRFKDEEAYSYARRILPDITNEESTSLGQAVEYLPLTFAQATAYIKGAGIGVDAYLKLYKKKGLDFLKKSVKNGGAERYPNSVAQTIAISAEKLRAKSPDAARMLLICSYLDSDNIPLKLLKRKQLLRDRETIYEALIALKSYSLVEPAKMPDSIQVNRFTQAVIRDENEKQGGSNLFILSEIADALISYCPWDKVTDSDFEKARLLLPHMQSVLNYIESQTKITEEESGLIAPTEGRLLSNIAKIFSDLGNYDEAKKLYDQALPIIKKCFGVDNEEAARALIGLSYVDEALGNKELALQEAIEAHQIMASNRHHEADFYAQRVEKLRGDNHNQTNKDSKGFLAKYLMPLFMKIASMIGS